MQDIFNLNSHPHDRMGSCFCLPPSACGLKDVMVSWCSNVQILLDDVRSAQQRKVRCCCCCC